jgi:hypothetical protein
MLKPSAVLGAALLMLAGCGGSSNADKVALVAKSEVQTRSGSCARVRDDAISGRVVTLYDCTMKDVAPQHRVARFFTDPTQHFCFAYANNTAVNVSQRFGLRCGR